jgi:uncharacterized protein YndB with AHSA1/START domain
MTLAHQVARTLVIRAHRETVFQFFTDSSRWAAWWGAGSTIDARPGGQVLIRHPNGVEVSGEVLDVLAPERIVFTYGHANGSPIPPGGSRVTIQLDHHPTGTQLSLTHEFADERARDEHVQGWRFQLSLFANLIANTANIEATTIVDRWFAAWSEPDADARDRTLGTLVSPHVLVADKFSALAGSGDLRAHLAAVHRFMPGLRLQRRGAIRHCQWHVLADWVAVTPDGQPKGEGTNVFVLDHDQRIAGVTGFWSA